jgi:hypothetical protein
MEELADCELELECAIPAEQVEEHIRINARSGKPFLLDNKYELRDEPLAIVAGGPSLSLTIDRLRYFRNVMVCGTAHDHVISQGIYPTYAVHCDQAADLHAFQSKRNQCVYLIGTNVNPDLVKHLSDCQVYLWDMESGDWFDKKVFDGRKLIVGGSTAATRAISLGMVLGFRDFHMFGVDSCFEDNRNRHAYDYCDERETIPAVFCKVNGRRFQSSLQFVQQARDLQTMLKFFGHLFTLEVHGDSLSRDVVEDAKKNLTPFWNTRKKLLQEQAA